MKNSDAAIAYVYGGGFTRGRGPQNVYRYMLNAAPLPPPPEGYTK